MHVSLKIEIESGNSAFGETETTAREEVDGILKLLGYKILTGTEHSKIMDYNGNCIGKLFFEVEED